MVTLTESETIITDSVKVEDQNIIPRNDGVAILDDSNQNDETSKD